MKASLPTILNAGPLIGKQEVLRQTNFFKNFFHVFFSSNIYTIIYNNYKKNFLCTGNCTFEEEHVNCIIR